MRQVLLLLIARCFLLLPPGRWWFSRSNVWFDEDDQPSRYSRSNLAVHAGTRSGFAKAADAGADVEILDLEDASKARLVKPVRAQAAELAAAGSDSRRSAGVSPSRRNRLPDIAAGAYRTAPNRRGLHST
jgi:hypothetical protein